MNNCNVCSGPILSKYGTKFCSIKCSALNGTRIAASKRLPKPTRKCLCCQVEFIPHDYRTLMCSRSCSATYMNLRRGSSTRRRGMKCRCGKPVSKNAKLYCGRDCMNAYKSIILVEKWKSGEFDGCQENGDLSAAIRRYVLKKNDYKCSLCGWGERNPTTGLVPVQVHHKDGNSRNNVEINLDCMCPNCHSLTPTFGSLNKGRGRKYRVRSLHPDVASVA